MQNRQQFIESTALYRQFQPGDFLYGLNVVREPYAFALRKKTGALVTPDEYNNRLLEALRSSQSVDVIFQNKSVPLSPRKRKYIDVLDQTPILKLRRSSHFQVDRRLKLERDEKSIRHACKAALTSTDATKHFILDGIDAHTVFTKTENIDDKYYSYTSAELHFIVKNFELINGTIKFYLNGQETTLYQWIKDQKELNKFYDYLESKNRDASLNALNVFQGIPLKRPENGDDSIRVSASKPKEQSTPPAPTFSNLSGYSFDLKGEYEAAKVKGKVKRRLL